MPAYFHQPNKVHKIALGMWEATVTTVAVLDLHGVALLYELPLGMEEYVNFGFTLFLSISSPHFHISWRIFFFKKNLMKTHQHISANFIFVCDFAK